MRSFAEQDVLNRARLRAIENRLVALGVKDIKFCWSEYRHLPGQYVIDDVCAVIEAFLDGNIKPLEPLGDSAKEPPGGTS